jgi:hypothetical protein
MDIKANDGHKIAVVCTPNSSKRSRFLKVDDDMLIQLSLSWPLFIAHICFIYILL